MHHKKLFNLILLIFLSLISHHSYAQSSVWIISKGDSYFYLGGTIHVLTENDHPFPNEFNNAYNDADEIIFETDLVTSGSAKYQSQMINMMTYHDNRNLSSELAPKIYQKLTDFLATRQIPINSLLTFQPWGASLMLTLMEYERLGMTSEFGVDMHFYQRALKDNKMIGILETPEAQLKALASMAEIDPNQVIEYTLRDINQLSEFIKQITSSWRNGDLNALAKNPLIKQMEVETPAMFKALLIDRNNNWMHLLPSLIKHDDIKFVMVGTMHLVGKNGLLNLLKKQGFNVKQL